MLKLKIINKPKMLKIKCNFKFPEVVLANLQEKEIIPTKEKQEVIADSSYDGLSKVIVDKIPNEYIIPQGQIDITKNGTYDVTDKVSAIVNVPEKVLGTKTIRTNGTYKAIDDNLDGYSEVSVETSGVDINDYYDLTKKNNETFAAYIKRIPQIDTSDYTSLDNMFNGYKSLVSLPNLNTNKATSLRYAFYSCINLQTNININTNLVSDFSRTFYNCKEIEEINLNGTSNANNFNRTFSLCSKLKTVHGLIGDKLQDMDYCFSQCLSLENFSGILNLGQAYSTSSSANYYAYTLDLSDCSKLTHESLMNVINGLYDIASAGIKPQQLILGTKNLTKLTDEEKAIAQNKGWTLL